MDRIIRAILVSVILIKSCGSTCSIRLSNLTLPDVEIDSADRMKRLIVFIF